MATPAWTRPGLLRAWLLGTTALLPAATGGLAQGVAQGVAPNTLPTGGQVSAGAASIAQSGNAMQVRQSSNRAAINWQGFSVGANARVNFQQPNAGAWTLNRVVGADPSVIAGRITANGGVAIVNQSGVVFAAGAQVNVGSLIASAANITNDNFMAGKLVFNGAPRPGATVENHGSITIADRGLAALVGPRVANSGTIRARLGRVALAGAETFSIDLAGDGLLSIDVTQAVRTAAGGGAALVTNSGVIEAHGGSVLLTAHAASGLVEDLVRNTGSIAANSAAGRTGQVALRAEGGGVRVDGSVSATGRGQQTGGRIEVRGSTATTIAGTATLNASGDAGGGSVLVGTTGVGRSQTMGATTTVAAGARISADARRRGNGGTVAMNSTSSTVVNGSVSARGGRQGGNGGFIELSGQERLALQARVDLAAPKGKAGTLLLDLQNITVVAALPGDPVVTGGAGSNTVTPNGTNTVSASAGTGTTFVTAGSLNALDGVGMKVQLEAKQTITVQAAISLANSTLNLFADGAISQTGTGTITAGTLVIRGIDLGTAAGSVTLGLANSIGTLQATVTNGLTVNNGATPMIVGTAQGSAVTLTTTGALSLQGAVGGGAAVVVLNVDGAVSQNAAGIITAAALTVRNRAGAGAAPGDINLGGATNAVASIDIASATGVSFVNGSTPLAVAGLVAPVAVLATGGNINFTGTTQVGTALTLATPGNVSQSGAGNVSTALLTVTNRASTGATPGSVNLGTLTNAIAAVDIRSSSVVTINNGGNGLLLIRAMGSSIAITAGALTVPGAAVVTAAAGGTISLRVDSLAWGGLIDASTTGTLEIGPRNNATTVSLGAGGTGSLKVEPGSFDTTRLVAGTFTVGETTIGASTLRGNGLVVSGAVAPDAATVATALRLVADAGTAISVEAPVTLAGRTVSLLSSGAIGQTAAGRITAATLNVGAPGGGNAGAVALNAVANAVDTAGLSAGTTLDFTSANALTVAGATGTIVALTAPSLSLAGAVGGTTRVSLNTIAGGIGQSGAGIITTPDLRLNVAGGDATLILANAVDQFRASAAGQAVSFTSANDLTLAGSISGTTVSIIGRSILADASQNPAIALNLTTTNGGITQTAGITLRADTMNFVAVGGDILLGAGDHIAMNASFSAVGRAVTYTQVDDALSVSGASGATVAITAPSITLRGATIATTSLALTTTAGAITQNAAGVVTTPKLTATAVGGAVDLGTANDASTGNSITTLGASSSTAGVTIVSRTAMEVDAAGIGIGAAAGSTIALNSPTLAINRAIGFGAANAGNLVALTADALTATAAIDAGASGRVAIAPRSSTRGIDIGGATAGALQLSAATLGQVTAGRLMLSTAGATTLGVNANLTLAGVDKLEFVAGNGITQDQATIITTAKLAATTGAGDISLGGPNQIGAITGSFADATTGLSAAGGITLVNAAALVVDAGVVAGNARTIAITATGLTTSASIATTGSSAGNRIDLQADTVVLGANVTATGGLLNILPNTAGRAVRIGGADGVIASTLYLPTSQFRFVQLGAGTLRIGGTASATTAGTITLGGEVPLRASVSGGAVVGGSAATLDLRGTAVATDAAVVFGLNVANLTGITSGSFLLTRQGNAIDTSGAISGSSVILLSDLALAVNGPIDGGAGSVTLRSGGLLTLAGDILATAGVTLGADGAILQTSGKIVSGAVAVVGYNAQPTAVVLLRPENDFGTLTGSADGSFQAFSTAATAGTLTISGITSGSSSVTSARNLRVDGGAFTATAGAIALEASGTVTLADSLAATGNITLLANAAAGVSAITQTVGTIQSGATSTIGLTADTITLLGAANSVRTGAAGTDGLVLLRPRTDGRAITLGGVVANTFSIGSGGGIAAGRVLIGRTEAGPIAVAGNFGVGASTLELITGGAISQAGGTVLTAGGLSATAGGAISLDGHNLIDMVAGSTADAAKGLTSGSNIALTTARAGGLATSAAIAAVDGGSITLRADALALGATVGASTGNLVALNILPNTVGTAVTLGANAAGLALDGAEIGFLRAGTGTLRIGGDGSSVTAGAITVAGDALLRGASASAAVLDLRGDSVAQTGGLVAVATLTGASAAGGFALDRLSAGTPVNRIDSIGVAGAGNTVAVTATGGSVAIASANALTVRGNVTASAAANSGTAGVSLRGNGLAIGDETATAKTVLVRGGRGNVLLNAGGGALTTSAVVTLRAQDAVSLAAEGTAGDVFGNILLSGGTVTLAGTLDASRASGGRDIGITSTNALDTGAVALTARRDIGLGSTASTLTVQVGGSLAAGRDITMAGLGAVQSNGSLIADRSIGVTSSGSSVQLGGTTTAAGIGPVLADAGAGITVSGFGGVTLGGSITATGRSILATAVGGTLTATGALSTATGGSITLNATAADGRVLVTAPAVIGGGAVTISAARQVQSLGSINGTNIAVTVGPSATPFSPAFEAGSGSSLIASGSLGIRANSGDIGLTSATLQAGTTLRLTASAGSITQTQGSTTAAGAVTLQAATGITVTAAGSTAPVLGSTAASLALTTSGGDLLLTEASITAGTTLGLTATAGAIRQTGGTTSGAGAVTLQAGTGIVIGQGSALSPVVATGLDTLPVLRSTGAGLGFSTVAGDIALTNATVSAATAISGTAGNDAAQGGSIAITSGSVIAGTSLALVAVQGSGGANAGTLTATGTTLTGGTTAALTAGGGLTATTSSLGATAGALVASAATGNLLLDTATVSAGTTLGLAATAGGLTQTGGSITAGTTLSLTSGGDTTQLAGGRIIAPVLTGSAGGSVTLMNGVTLPAALVAKASGNSITAIAGYTAGGDFTLASNVTPLQITGLVSAGAGRALRLFADDVAVTAGLAAPGVAPLGSVTLSPYTRDGSIALVLGGPAGSAANTLTLDRAELALLPVGGIGSLRFGRTDNPTGLTDIASITIAGTVDLGTRAGKLELNTRGTITQDVGTSLIVPLLAATAGADISLDPGSSANRIGGLAGIQTPGSFSLRTSLISGAAMTIGAGSATAGDAGASSFGDAILVGSGQAITLRADDLAIGAAVRAPAGTITVLADTSGRGITLGGAGAGTLSLSAAEVLLLGGDRGGNLDSGAATVLRIDASTVPGDITIAGAVNLQGATARFQALELLASGNVAGSGGAVNVPVLRAVVAGNLVLDNAGNSFLLNRITAANASIRQVGDLRLANAVAALGDVDALGGIAAPGGTVRLISGGSITQGSGATIVAGTLAVSAGNTVTLTEANAFDILADVAILGGGASSIRAANYGVTGPVTVTGGLSLVADTGLGVTGNIGTSGALALTTTIGDILLNGATVTAGAGLTMTAGSSPASGGDVFVTGGSIGVTGAAVLTATRDGTLANPGNISLSGTSVTASTDLTLAAGGGIIAGTSTLAATGGAFAATAATGGIGFTSSTASGGTSATLAAATGLTVIGGGLAANGGALLASTTTGNLVLDSASVTATGTLGLTATAGAVSQRRGTTSGGGRSQLLAQTGITVTADGGAAPILRSTGERLILNSATGAIALTGVTATAGADAVIAGDAVSITGGSLLAGASAQVTAAAGTIALGGTSLTAATDLSLQASLGITAGTTVLAATGGVLAANATAGGNGFTTVTASAGGNLSLAAATGAVTLTGSSATAGGGATLLGGTGVSLATSGVTANGGALAVTSTAGDIGLTGSSLTGNGSSGTVTVIAGTDPTLGGDVTITSSTLAGRSLTVQAVTGSGGANAGDLTVTGSSLGGALTTGLRAGGTLAVAGGSIAATSGLLSLGAIAGAATLDSTALSGQGIGISAGGLATLRRGSATSGAGMSIGGGTGVTITADGGAAPLINAGQFAVVTGGGDILVTGAQVQARATEFRAGNGGVLGGDIGITGGSLTAGSLVLTAIAGTANAGTIGLSGTSISTTTGAGATLTAAAGIAVAASTLAITGGLAATTATGDLSLDTSTVTATGTLGLTATTGAITQRRGSTGGGGAVTLQAGSGITVTADGGAAPVLRSTGASLAATTTTGDLTLGGATLSAATGLGLTAAAGAVGIGSSGVTAGTNTILAAGTGLGVTSSTVTANTGAIGATATSGGITLASTTLTAATNQTLLAGGAIGLTGSTLTAGGLQSLTAGGTLGATGSTLTATGNQTLAAGTGLSLAGTTVDTQAGFTATTSLGAATLTDTTLAAAGTLSLTAMAGAVTQTRGSLIGGGDTRLRGGTNVTITDAGSGTAPILRSTGGSLGITADAGNVVLANARLAASGGLGVTAGGGIGVTDSGLATASGTLSLAATAGNLILLRGTLASAAGDLDLTAGGGGSLTTTSLGAPSPTGRVRVVTGGPLTLRSLGVTADAADLEAGRLFPTNPAAYGQTRASGVLTNDGIVATIGTKLLFAGPGGITDLGLTLVLPRAIALPAVIYDTRLNPAANPLGQVLPDVLGVAANRQATQVRSAPGALSPGAFGLPDQNTAAGNVAMDVNAGQSAVFLLVDGGNIQGNIVAGRLGVHGTGGGMSIFGTLDGSQGAQAARFADITRPIGANDLQRYRINGCVISSVNCVVPPSIQIIPPRPTDRASFTLENNRVNTSDVLIPNIAEEDED